MPTYALDLGSCVVRVEFPDDGIFDESTSERAAYAICCARPVDANDNWKLKLILWLKKLRAKGVDTEKLEDALEENGLL